jgi:hypothetical protein
MKRIKGLLIAFTLVAGVSMWYSCENEGDDNEGGANHNVGNNCLVCHKAGGGGDGIFTVGGTVYKTGTTTGATGATIKLYSNAEGTGTAVAAMTSEVGGNFYTKSSINFGTGLYVKVTSSNGTSSMMSPITSGACNSCHGVSTDKITVQ